MLEEIDKLIADEIEAIEGYDAAIKKFNGDEVVVEQLAHIRDEEKQHIEELKQLKVTIVVKNAL